MKKKKVSKTKVKKPKFKKCRVCSQTYSISHFHKNKTKPDGYQNECILCRSEHNTGLRPTMRSQLQKVDLRGSGIKRVIVSWAGVDSKVNKKALKSIEKFLKIHDDASFVVIGGRTQVRALHDQPEIYDHRLTPYLCKEVVINNNIVALDTEINPQRINPLTSMDHFGRKSGRQSVIIGHPKQMGQHYATNDHPRMICSTGSITEPDYLSDSGTARIAEQNHQLGFMLIELIDNERFLPRVIKIQDDGSFTVLDRNYSSKGVKEDPVVSLYSADPHIDSWGNTLKHRPYKTLVEMLDFFNKPRLYSGDFFSFEKTSHHNKKNIFQRNKLSIKDVIGFGSKVISDICKHTSFFTVIKGNHNDHLIHYLLEGDFRDSGDDYGILCKLGYHLYETDNPLESYYKELLNDENFRFAKEGEREQLLGYEHLFHGDKAAKGTRGSLVKIERSVPRSFIGHSHSSGWINWAMQSGYMGGGETYAIGGLSDWTETHIILTKSGYPQILPIIDGIWRI